jgi:hypothetical protein
MRIAWIAFFTCLQVTPALSQAKAWFTVTDCWKTVLPTWELLVDHFGLSVIVANDQNRIAQDIIDVTTNKVVVRLDCYRNGRIYLRRIEFPRD